jgi:hypothetical protein
MVTLGFAAMLATACASSTSTSKANSSPTSGGFLDMMYPEMDPDLEEISKHALGTRGNPVRADRPSGQRAYLSRLRCANGETPKLNRIGNFGLGPYSRIIDGYKVECKGEEDRTIVLDMYHPGYVEKEPVEGFTIKPDSSLGEVKT